MNWPLACVFIALALSMPLMGWAMAWAERRAPGYYEKAARGAQRIDEEGQQPLTPFEGAASTEWEWKYGGLHRVSACPVLGCHITKAHSHVDALLDKLRGEK